MGRSSRSWYAVWDLLDREQRDAIRARQGYPEGWRPPPMRQAERRRQLEGLEELARIMRWKPGYVAQLKEELVERIGECEP